MALFFAFFMLFHLSLIFLSTGASILTLSHLGGLGADSAPPKRLSLITPKRHKLLKGNFSGLILHLWGSCCT